MRPSDFMRARRPEYFSDSTQRSQIELPKEVFEYHLHTLTSRKEEYVFEDFCRRLAQKELCPNLLPQSGPTGGGDSKTDAETFPVADAIADRWYEGLGRESAKDRWAFAFSAKEKWRPKVKSDVEKIVATGRDYKLIYFMTNQFVSDKKRSDVEDELREKYGVDIRILDRNWIVEQVYNHCRLEMAVKTLNITGFVKQTKFAIGPKDTVRLQELEKLETQIADSEYYKGVNYQLVEDCLRVAILSRGLGKDRNEIDGQFSRAKHLAKKVGIKSQIARVVYNNAWTAYWWYNDTNQLAELYDEVEQYLIGSSLAGELELLSNLLNLIIQAVASGAIDKESVKLDDRTKKLITQLKVLTIDGSRPNNSLYARSLLVIMKLTLAIHQTDDEAECKALLLELECVIEDSDGLGSFPFAPISEIITELGGIFNDWPEYDKLFEKSVASEQKRKMNYSAGLRLLARGEQKLQSNKWNDAVGYLGRAQQSLLIQEAREDLVSAHVMCSFAYERGGLLWAARACMLVVSSLYLQAHAEGGNVLSQLARICKRMVWLEIQLGRIPEVLSWWEIGSALLQHVRMDDDVLKDLEQERSIQDGTFGILFLRMNLNQLKLLGKLPKILEHLGFQNAPMALLYALGQEDVLRKEWNIPEEESKEDMDKLFKMQLEQPICKDLPNDSNLVHGEKLIFETKVLGCKISVECESKISSIYLAEAILSAFECLMATSIGRRVVPHTEQMLVKLVCHPDAPFIPEYQFEKNNTPPVLVVRHREVIEPHNKNEMISLSSWTSQIVLESVTQIAIFEDIEKFMEGLAKEEQALGRCFGYSDIVGGTENLLGKFPKKTCYAWFKGVDGKELELKREISFYDSKRKKPEFKPISEKLAANNTLPPPSMIFDPNNSKHSAIDISSLIDVSLWDDADWNGVGYAMAQDFSIPPVLMLLFRNRAAGMRIFEQWKNRIGDKDKHELLRISIITGVKKKNPAHYNVVIGSNPLVDSSEENTKYFYLTTRINSMEPENTLNQDMFFRHYRSIGCYSVVPAHFGVGMPEPEIISDLAILKCQLRRIEAWRIGRNDPDGCGIRLGDDPIIPKDKKDPPVNAVLERHNRKTNG